MTNIDEGVSAHAGTQQGSDPSSASHAPPSSAQTPATTTSIYGTVGNSDDGFQTVDIEDAMERLGMGAFQLQILLAAVSDDRGSLRSDKSLCGA